MKKNPTNTGPAILPMAEVKKLDAGALTNLFVTSSVAGRVAYIGCAKALIALVATLGIESAKTRLLQAGAKESDIRNGRQLSLVWEEFYEPGHLTEAQFNELRYSDAVALRTVKRTRGLEVAMANLADMDEIAHIAEYGITRAEAADKAERDAKKLAEAHATAAKAKAASAATPEVVSPVATTVTANEGTPSNVVPMHPAAATDTAKTETGAAAKAVKPRGRPMTEFGRLADTLEATALAIVKDTSVTQAELAVLVERLLGIARTVGEAAAAVQAAPVAVAA
jgi:hypothetical protein